VSPLDYFVLVLCPFSHQILGALHCNCEGPYTWTLAGSTHMFMKMCLDSLMISQGWKMASKNLGFLN